MNGRPSTQTPRYEHIITLRCQDSQIVWKGVIEMQIIVMEVNSRISYVIKERVHSEMIIS